MPDLNTKLHLNMLKNFNKSSSLPIRLLKAMKKEILSKGVYGLDWGDPDIVAPLTFVRDQYVLPYVNSSHKAIEIGPGGGRWTRYLFGFGELYVVDYYSELLEQLQKIFVERI